MDVHIHLLLGNGDIEQGKGKRKNQKAIIRHIQKAEVQIVESVVNIEYVIGRIYLNCHVLSPFTSWF